MEYRPHHCNRMASNFYSLLLKILAIGVAILASGKRANTISLYVSITNGEDNNGLNTCRNMSLPCKTLSYVINQASANDVIMMDSRNTTLQPYNNCSSRPIKRALTFKSWKGYPAIINCSGNGLVFSALGAEVRFDGLTFLDTFVNLTNVSLVVNNCLFSTSSLNTNFQYLIDFSVFGYSHTNLKIAVTNSNVTENNVTGFLRVTNNAISGVNVEIDHSSFTNNTVLQGGSLIYLAGFVNFTFLNSEISHTKLPNKNLPSIILIIGYYEFQTSVSMSVHFSGGQFFENEADIFLGSFNIPTYVVIADTNFSRNTNNYETGAAVTFHSSRIAQLLDVYFKNCWFTSNFGRSYATVIYLINDDSVRTNITLESCFFNKNKHDVLYPPMDIGSLVFISASQLLLSVKSCGFYQNNGGTSGMFYVGTSHQSNLHFSRTNITSCSSFSPDANHEPGAGITVLLIKNAPEWGGEFARGLWINECQFHNNTAWTHGTGALTFISIHNPIFPMEFPISITKSSFRNNLAQFGAGAIAMTSSSRCVISDTVFINNAGFDAGGIYYIGGDITLRNCTLDNNYGGSTLSTYASGSLRLTNNGKVSIKDSKIVQREISQSFQKERNFSRNSLQFQGTVGVSSSNLISLSVWNSTFEFLWKPSIAKAIVMEISLTNLIMDNSTIIRCPVGYLVQNVSKGEPGDYTNGVSFLCRLCDLGTYSVVQGYYHLSGKHSVKCLKCPYGAKCTTELQVLPNFWGYKIQNSNPPTVAFSICPAGYCCQPKSHHETCVPYNTCNARRLGRLCGECRLGFSETLFTPSCRKSENCNDIWFWPVAIMFVSGFTLYIILQPNFVLIIWNFITWSSRDISRNDVTTFDPGYERVVFFYYQATDILLVKSSVDLLNLGSHFVLGMFNFEIRLNSKGFACPFRGMNPVSKIFFRSLGVLSILFAIPSIYLLHYLLCFCLRRSRPNTGQYLSAFLKVILLGYAVFTEKCMRLLHCVEINGINCLFINCNTECYTWWQSLIGTSIIVIIIPFALILFFGAYKLFNKVISEYHFLLSCFFPLPYLSYWFLARRTLCRKNATDSDGRDAITSVLIGSYRVPDHVSRGTIYWESVFIARILLLIVADVLIKEPFLRSLTLLLICVVNLTVHVYVFPFKLLTANRAETISLFCLVLLAIFSVPYSAYLSEGVLPSGPISHILSVFSWGQAALVGFLPCVCILLVLIAMVSQAVRFLCFITKSCFRWACSRSFCCFLCLEDGNQELLNAGPLVP